jgi:TPR repeat protein
VLYENGRGVRKDIELAEYLYRTVVEKFGNGEFADEAKTRLALIQANIIRGPVSGETKADYWRRMQENLWGKKGNKS